MQIRKGSDVHDLRAHVSNDLTLTLALHDLHAGIELEIKDVTRQF